MSILERDLVDSQSNIITWLNQYEKVSQETIKFNYNYQLHLLLDSISSFDCNKIKQTQLHFKDQVTIKHIERIVQKIKQETSKVKEEKAQLQENQVSKKINEQKSMRSAKIEESKTVQKNKKEGFFGNVMKRFISKEKKPSQIILPDEEPNCYYDPVTRSYIFQGQQPEVPKVIPKPPSIAEKKIAEPSKQTAKKNDDSQLGQMTAPPAFKRKSTFTDKNAKNKLKPKQQPQAALQIQQPLNFHKVLQNINGLYNALIQKVKAGAYEEQIRHIPNNKDNESLEQIINFTQKCLNSSYEISAIQAKMIEKWTKMAGNENKQLRLLQKVVQQIQNSTNIYEHVIRTIDQYQAEKPVSYVISEPIPSASLHKNYHQNERNSNDNQRIFELEMKLQQQRENNSQLCAQRTRLLQQNQELRAYKTTIIFEIQVINIKYKNEYQNSQQQNHRLNQCLKQLQSQRNYTNQLKQQIQSFAVNLQQTLQQKKEQINMKLSKLVNEKNGLQNENDLLQNQAQKLRNEIKDLNITIYNLQNSYKNSYSKINSELSQQKVKIQAQLKIYEEKEQKYIKSFKNIQEHENIIQEFQSTLYHENQLLNTLLEKRIQLAKNSTFQQSSTYLAQFNFQHSSESIILELSDVVTTITETYLDRLQNFNHNYSKLYKKYLQSKEYVNKIKNQSENENISLNRSVTRLKNLIETYKNAKEEVELKCSQLQLQNDKLRKKLFHYKEEDQFNKSYLSKIKNQRANSNNESVVSLQQDNEQLASEINDLQKQVDRRQESLSKLQKDLQDLLINYQKNQTKLLQTEKKYKEQQKQLRSLKQQREHDANKLKLIELKLQNQLKRNDQILVRQESRVKNVQSNYEKKIVIFKNQIEQLNQSADYNKAQLIQMTQAVDLYKYQLELQNERFINRQNELKLAIEEKESEICQLIELANETGSKLQQQQKRSASMQWRYRQEQSKKKELQSKLKMSEEKLAAKQYKVDELSNDLLSTKQQTKSFIKMNKELTYKVSKLQDNIDKKQQTISSLQQQNIVAKEQHQQQILSLRQNQNEMNLLVQNILQKYQTYKRDEANLKEDYHLKIFSLQEQIQLSNLQSHQLLQQINHYSQLIQVMGDKIASTSSLSLQNQALKDENSRIQGQLNQLNDVLSQMQSQIVEKDTIVSQLQLDNAALLDAVQNGKTKVEKSLKNSEVQTLKNELDKKQQELMICLAQLQLLPQIQNQVLEKDKIVSQLQLDNAALLDAIQDSKVKVQNYLKMNTDMSEKVILMNSEVQTLKNELDKKEQELMICLAQLQQKEGVILQRGESTVIKNQQIDQYTNQIRKKDQQIKQLREDVQYYINELQNEKSQENNQIESKGQAQESEIAELLEQMQKLNAQIDNLKSQLGQRQVIIQANREKISQLTMLSQQKQIKVNNLVSQLNSTNKQLQQLLILVKSSQDELESIKQQNKGLKEAMLNLQSHSQHHEEQKLTNSYQLKLTQIQHSYAQKMQKYIQQANSNHLKIEELEQIVSDKESSIIQLIEQIQKIRVDGIKIEDNKDIQIEGEMQQLLKEIDSKQNEIVALNDRLQKQAKQIELLTQKAKIPSSLIEKVDELEVNALQMKVEQLQKQKEELLLLMDDMQNEKKELVQQIQSLQRYNAERQTVQSSHPQAISQQDVKRAIESKDQQIKQLESSVNEITQQCNHYQVQLHQKDKDIQHYSQKYTHAQQQNIQLTQQQEELHSIILKLEESNEQLQAKLNEMKTLGVGENKERKGEKDVLESELSEIKKKMHDSNKYFAAKQKEYEQKIQSLQKDIINLPSLRLSIKKLQDEKKVFEVDYNTLINEKVELMKSNDYLFNMNQKLIADKSPQNPKDQKPKDITKPSNVPSKLVNEPPKSEIKEVPKVQNKQKVQATQQSKGFFERTLSSLFLTPTQKKRVIGTTPK